MPAGLVQAYSRDADHPEDAAVAFHTLLRSLLPAAVLVSLAITPLADPTSWGPVEIRCGPYARSRQPN